MKTEIGRDIDHAVELLEKGEIVAIPTETVYGLAGNALNADAVVKIYEAKDRPRFNPLIIHIASADQMNLYAENITEKCFLLAKKYSPGPITFLLPKKDIIPDLVTAGSDKVAIRIPNHPMTLQLLKKINFPLAAPSANPSGYVSPVTAQHVLDGLDHKIPYILDGGECKVGVESTIVGFENDEVIIHRLGGVGIEAIENTLQQKVKLILTSEEPESPGQLKSHYATKKPLYYGNVDELRQQFKDKKIAVITLKENYEIGSSLLFRLSPSGDLNEAAANLFNVLRMIDRSDTDIILADEFPNEGLGRAINDRLQKAQHVLK